MSTVCVGFVRRTITDDAAHNDQRGLVIACLEVGEAFARASVSFCIFNTNGIPTEPFESLGHVLTECEIGMTFDGDTVIVIDPAKIRKL